MDLVYRLNEHYERFVSEYSRLYQSGNTSLANSLYETWTFWLLKTAFHSNDRVVKRYMYNLKDNSDKFVARTKKNESS